MNTNATVTSNLMLNLILNTDSYKCSHFCQYPEQTTRTHFYIESRGGRYDETLFFGLQMFLKAYLAKGICEEDIEEAKSIITAHGLPFYEAGWRYILEKHQGKLPIRISAVPEGSVIATHNVLLTIENTDPKCFWLPGYLETALLRAIWYPSTVATTSLKIKEALLKFHEKSSDAPRAMVDFMLHDFGARGASSSETSAIGGLAHLVSFKGTDTIGALVYGKKFYASEMAGFSVPAAEHSTITVWGRDSERDAFENMLNQFAKPGAIVSVVSDSYDIYYAVDQLWGKDLYEKVKNSGARIVVRPDSGDPMTVPVEVIDRLMNHFGYTTNSKGYRVLPDCVRVIQGDGVDPASISEILKKLDEQKIAIDNIVFGMGAALLQKVNRDTQKFAMKCSAAEVKGEWVDVFKDPITDLGKRSKAGLLALVRSEVAGKSTFETVLQSELKGRENLLRPVFENGQLLIDESLDFIRSRLRF
jgi:nicotinamide phosphoribosyltransferase